MPGARRLLDRSRAAQRDNFLFRQLPVLADLESADFDVADRSPHQLQHFRAQRFHHAPNLPIAPFRDRNLEECEARRDVVHRPARPASSASTCIMRGASRDAS